MSRRKLWLIGLLMLTGCGLSAAAVGGLVAALATAIATGASVYVAEQPSPVPSATATPLAEATPLAQPTLAAAVSGDPLPAASSSATPAAPPAAAGH